MTQNGKLQWTMSSHQPGTLNTDLQFEENETNLICKTNSLQSARVTVVNIFTECSVYFNRKLFDLNVVVLTWTTYSHFANRVQYRIWWYGHAGVKSHFKNRSLNIYKYILRKGKSKINSLMRIY